MNIIFMLISFLIDKARFDKTGVFLNCSALVAKVKLQALADQRRQRLALDVVA